MTQLEHEKYTSSPSKPLLRSREVATWLGVSRRTVYRLIESGALTPIYVGSRLRFSADEVRAYLDRHRQRG